MIEAVKAESKKRTLRYGMIGGGPGSFIGVVHRSAIGLDGHSELVAGCFSSDPVKSQETGENLGVESDRIYKDAIEMAEKEAAREDCIDFAVVTAPNYAHFEACKAFLEKGIDVFCEKPLAMSSKMAEELKELADAKGCILCVGYTYTGHVMAKEAREIIRSGAIGEVKIVIAEYIQDWLMDIVENDSKQASWRTDPKRSGISNCVGDIGTHMENMVQYMTGLKISKLCANLDIVGEGRTLDTNAEILVKYNNGASGSFWCSQVACGYDNAFHVRIFGTKGAVEFDQEASNYLKVSIKGQPPRIYSRGCGYICPEAAAYSRLPSGHPEGYHDALANLYQDFTNAIYKKLAGEKLDEEPAYPTAQMGVDGVRFIEKCVESSAKGSVWVDME